LDSEDGTAGSGTGWATGESGGVNVFGYDVMFADEDGADLVKISGVSYAPVTVNGVDIAVSLHRSGDDTVFFAQSTGGDFAKAKAVLEALSIGADGEWADSAVAGDLPSPAAAEAAGSDLLSPDALDGDGAAGVTSTEEDGVISDTDEAASGSSAEETAGPGAAGDPTATPRGAPTGAESAGSDAG
jgi:hypothetical protein